VSEPGKVSRPAKKKRTEQLSLQTKDPIRCRADSKKTKGQTRRTVAKSCGKQSRIVAGVDQKRYKKKLSDADGKSHGGTGKGDGTS